jgi:autotransporter-associated beta strand protein
MKSLRLISLFLCLGLLAISVLRAADPLGLTPGTAATVTLGSIQTLANYNTSIATGEISYSNTDLATRPYVVRLPAGYDPTNPAKKYGLVTFINAGGAVSPGSYAAALDAHDVIWISGDGIDNNQSTNVRRGVALMGAFRIAELYRLDPNRIYASGLSGGGRTASDLAYLRSDFFHGFIGRVGASIPGNIPGWECAGTNSGNSDANYEFGSGSSVVLPTYFRTAIMTQYGDFRRAENMAIYRFGHLNHGNTTRLIMRNGGHSDEVGASFTDALDFLYHPLVDVIWDRFENAHFGANVQAGKTVAGGGFTALSGTVAETTYSYNTVSHGVLKLTGTGAAVRSNDTFAWQSTAGILVDARLRGETATSANQNQQIGLHIVPAAAAGAPADQPGLHVYWCYGQSYRAEFVSATGVRKTLATWDHTATHPMSLAATDKTFWGDTAAPDYAGKTKSFRGEDVRLVLNSGGFQLTLNRFAANVTTAAGVTLLSSDGSTPYGENIPMVLQGFWSEIDAALVNALPTGNWGLALTNDALLAGQACGNAVIDEIRVVGAAGLQAAPATLLVTAPANGQRFLTWAQIYGATGYVIQRSTTPDTGFVTLATVGSHLATHTDTTASLTNAYYYRVAALGGDGLTPGNASAQAYAARTGTVPSAPTTASVTYPASYQVRITWADTATTETGYRIERSPAGTAQWSVLVTGLVANTTSYLDTTVLAGSAYEYRISAYGAAGISGFASVTAAPPDVAPAVPTGLVATTTYGQVSLTWNPVALARSYTVKRATAIGGPYAVIASGLTATSFIDTTFSPGGTLYYVVSAVSGGSAESANSTPVTVTPPVLALPTQLTATPGYGAIALTWTVGAEVESYRIQRATLASGPYTLLATGVVGDFYADAGLTAGTTYYYTVQSVKGGYVSAAVGPVNATPLIRPAATSAAAPVTGANLLLHLDATQTATIVKDEGNKVSRWNHASGGAHYAALTTGATPPTAVTDAGGMPQIDFGAYVLGSSGAWLQFRNAAGSDVSFGTIRTVFAVMKGANFLLGDGGSYQFHRGGDTATSPLWNSTYVSGNILNGTTRLNGHDSPLNGATTDQPTGFWLASVQTTGNVTGSRLANDRNSRTGGQQIAELLIYDRVFSDAERKATTDYLMLKWFGVQLPATLAAPVITQQPVACNAVEGSAATFSVSVTGRALTYQWRKNGVPLPGASSAAFTLSAVQLADAGAYDVVITNPLGTVTSTAANLAVYLALAPPTGLTATLVNGEITLHWNAVAGATSYTLLRSRSSTDGFTSLASGVTGTSYTDTGAVALGGFFYYQILSNSSGGAGVPSSSVLPAPTSPTGLSATPALVQVTLNWTGAPYATSYRIQRSSTSGGLYTTIATVASSVTTYTDTGRPSGVAVYYQVIAVNSEGTANSVEVTATPPAGVFQKADNATALDAGASWTPGFVPGALDTALWTGTYTTGATVGIGGGLTVNQLRLTSPSQAITLNAGTGPLSLGAGGVDLSTATQNLTVASPVLLAASQSWAVAAGRTLTVTGDVSDGGLGCGLTLAGAGTVVLLTPATYTGPTTFSAGTLAYDGVGVVAPFAGPLHLAGGTLRINQAAATLTLNATNLPTGSSNAFTTLTGASGSTFVVDGSPTSSLGFGGSVGGMNLTVKIGAVRFTTSGGSFNFRIEGGSFTSTPTDRFQLATANQTFTVTGGTVDLTAATQYGFRLGGGGSPTQGGSQKVSGNQTGGSVSVAGFNLGGTDTDAVKSPAYTLSGGLLSTAGNLQLGADTAGNGTATFTLAGGKLKVPFTISGAQTGAKQIFAFTGGTLVAGTVNATQLRNQPTGTNGTLVQSGGTFAPGDLGTAGRTVVTGNYQLGTGGTLALDLGGTTQATAFQNTSGGYDFLNVGGTTTLAGNLSVTLIGAFAVLATAPLNASTFTVLNSTGVLAGAFTNVAFGQRLATTGGEGTFLVTQVGTTVRLSQYLSARDTWRLSTFGTAANTGTAADLADPDGDGASNFIEYALGTTPTSAASVAVPVAQLSGLRLELTFPRARSDVTYAVEASADLAAWTTIATNPGIVGQSVTVADTVDLPTTNPPRRFLRLRVTAP